MTGSSVDTTHDVHVGDVLDAYAAWPEPVLICSDGPYGVIADQAGWDTASEDELAGLYEPHVAAWTKAASPATTVWLWNTEQGWARLDPVMRDHGWRYAGLVVLAKGLSAIAGRVNGDTVRSLPVETEVSCRYVRDPVFAAADGTVLTFQQWLRAEWARSGLARHRMNDAVGTKAAGARKYLAADPQWYPPSPEQLDMIEAYANTHGDPAGLPYFRDGRPEQVGGDWNQIRARWNHIHGLTNVWQVPPLKDGERVRDPANPDRYLHPTQKPRVVADRQVLLSSDPGEVVWEPFGGLCTFSVAAAANGRSSFAAELDPVYAQVGRDRIAGVVAQPFLL